jgi:hypothetical protein
VDNKHEATATHEARQAPQKSRNVSQPEFVYSTMVGSRNAIYKAPLAMRHTQMRKQGQHGVEAFQPLSLSELPRETRAFQNLKATPQLAAALHDARVLPTSFQSGLGGHVVNFGTNIEKCCMHPASLVEQCAICMQYMWFSSMHGRGRGPGRSFSTSRAARFHGSCWPVAILVLAFSY